MAAGASWRWLLISAVLSLQALPAIAQYPAYENKSAANTQQWPTLGLNIRDQYANRYYGVSTLQYSPASELDRPNQNYLQAQPSLTYNLAQGWYFRSSASWGLETRRDNYYAPVSLGKVFKMGGITYNMYAEPQWTATPVGTDESRFQMFFGLNLRLPQ